jgi:hypothetical protein
VRSSKPIDLHGLYKFLKTLKLYLLILFVAVPSAEGILAFSFLILHPSKQPFLCHCRKQYQSSLQEAIPILQFWEGRGSLT